MVDPREYQNRHADGHANIPYVIAIDFPVHMRYVGLICHKKIWSDRPKSSILWSTGVAGASTSPAVT